jgi:hypothetical protein
MSYSDTVFGVNLALIKLLFDFNLARRSLSLKETVVPPLDGLKLFIIIIKKCTC